MSLVYRIMTDQTWRRCQAAGVITPNPLDQQSGFMHLSGADALLETANRYFPTDTGPIALEFDAQVLGPALRWEPVAQRGGAHFPHLYAESLALDLASAVITLNVSESGTYRLGARQELAPRPPER